MTNNKPLLIGIGLLLLAGVGYWAFTQGPVTNSISPALAYCEQNGGNPDTLENEDGTRLEVCHMPEGEICEAEAFMTENVCVTPPLVGNFDDEGMNEPSSESEAAEAATRAQASEDTGVNEEEIVVVSVTAEEWSDGCLGLGDPAESCIFMITAGYEVVVDVQGDIRTYRTDAEGTVVREDIGQSE